MFLDVVRNSYGQTSVAPYAVRAIDGAPIATPLNWAEVSNKGLNLQKFNIKTIFKRLEIIKDLWEHLSRNHRSIMKLC